MVKLSLGALRLWLALALGLTSNLAGRDLPLARAVAIGEGVAAFLPAGFDAKANPSFAVASEPPERGALPNEWKIKPIFSQEGAAFETKIMLPGGTSLYGTGETTGPLLRNQQAITLWNTDNFA
ncbi:MAG: TIM-barrel domain-containing protein, partial [Chthoniobacterales bacterium]